MYLCTCMITPPAPPKKSFMFMIGVKKICSARKPYKLIVDDVSSVPVLKYIHCIRGIGK